MKPEKYKHSVLYHLPFPQENELPIPHRGSDQWDQVHVRLPSSPESLFNEIDSNGAKILRQRWELIKESLLQEPILNSDDFERAVKQYNNRYEDIWDFKTFHQLFREDSSHAKAFFDETLPKTIHLALRLKTLIKSPVPLLKQGMNYSLSMSQEQAACLLANAFLCTFPRRNTTRSDAEYANYPEINFNRLFQSLGQSVVEKLKCICNYFRRVTSNMPTGTITFQRRSLNENINWHSDVPLSQTKFHISSSGRIEEACGMLQVRTQIS